MLSIWSSITYLNFDGGPQILLLPIALPRQQEWYTCDGALRCLEVSILAHTSLRLMSCVPWTMYLGSL